MKHRHQFRSWLKMRLFWIRMRFLLFKRKLQEAKKYKFLWIGRFLFTWGWNGKKNTFSISFYKPDMETQIWSIGET